MATDYAFALQKAIYSTLDGALTDPVYDSVPSTASPPYVVIESQIATSADFLARKKDRIFVYLSVWSTYRGQKEVLGVMAEIYEALHQKSLTMDAGRMVRAYVTRRRTQRDVDERTFQGMVTVECLIEH